MSIDTVRVSCDEIEIKNLGCFEREISSVDMKTGRSMKKYITTGKSAAAYIAPRVTYFPPGGFYLDEDTGELNSSGIGRLVFEVSLPKYVKGENAHLLSDVEIEKGLKECVSLVQDMTGATVPGWQDWRVSRLDAVYSWQVGEDMPYYMGAFQGLPVPSYTRSPYIDGENNTQGFTWRAKTRRVNAYDKGLESKLDFAKGVLRLEVQALNGKACKTISERRDCDLKAGSLVSGGVGRDEVKVWLRRIGMGSIIVKDADIYSRLIEEFGYEDAAPRFFFIEGYRRFGSAMAQKTSAATYKRRLSEAKKNGWLLQAEKELSGLEVKGEKEL